MATLLKNVRFDRVDLVDIGANLDLETGDGSHVVLVKRAGAEDIDKIGRKISADRLRRLRESHEALAKIIAEAEADANGEESMADEKKEQDVAKRLAELETTIAKMADLEKQNAELVKSADELKKRADAAELAAQNAQAAADAEKTARLTREFEDIAKSFKALPVKPVDDAQVFMRISKAISAEDNKRLMEILRGADALIEEGKVTKQVGADRGEASPESAEGKLMAMAKDTVAKGGAKDLAEALQKAMSENPDLYSQYLGERRGVPVSE